MSPAVQSTAVVVEIAGETGTHSPREGSPDDAVTDAGLPGQDSMQQQQQQQQQQPEAPAPPPPVNAVLPPSGDVARPYRYAPVAQQDSSEGVVMGMPVDDEMRGVPNDEAARQAQMPVMIVHENGVALIHPGSNFLQGLHGTPGEPLPDPEFDDRLLQLRIARKSMKYFCAAEFICLLIFTFSNWWFALLLWVPIVGVITGVRYHALGVNVFGVLLLAVVAARCFDAARIYREASHQAVRIVLMVFVALAVAMDIYVMVAAHRYAARLRTFLKPTLEALRGEQEVVPEPRRPAGAAAAPAATRR
jgi:hypothetical protein